MWAGGLALALGGLFLVRYSIEAGLIGPGVRVVLGLALSAVLIAGGEWFRRNDTKFPIDAVPQAHIPSILTAAGTVVAFGTIYAAHALYGFIGPAFAFTALGATGIIAMLAAALHGPALAGLGLAGAFIAPLLVQSNAPNPWPVVLYLAVVAAAAYVLARTRSWLWLAAAAVTGAFVWGVLLLDQGGYASTAVAAHTLVQMALAAFFLAIEPHFGQQDSKATLDRVATAALAAMTLLAVGVTDAPDLGLSFITTFAALAITILGATAWLAAPAAAAALFGGVIALSVLLLWPGLSAPPGVSLLAPWAEHVLRLPDNVTRFMSFAALATLVPAAAALLRVWRGALLKEKTAALYCLAATVPPLLALVIAYLRITQFDVSIPFALGGVALAAAVRNSGRKIPSGRHVVFIASLQLSGRRFCGGRDCGNWLCADGLARTRLPDGRTRARGPWHSLCRDPARYSAVAPRRHRARPRGIGARGVEPAHHGRKRWIDAHFQLAAAGIRRAGSELCCCRTDDRKARR